MKYGRGVNADLVSFLTKEIEILRSPNGTLDDLDRSEVSAMQPKQMEPDTDSDPVSSERNQFWLRRARVVEEYEKYVITNLTFEQRPKTE